MERRINAMTEGERLMGEYAGVILTRKNAAGLAVRIDRLIGIAVGTERLRCIVLAQDAWSKIIKPDHAPSRAGERAP